jgi:hypothetical protein
MEQVRQEAELAERDYDLNRAAELRLGRLPELERRLQAEEEQLASRQGGARLLREVVTDEEIAAIVSRWTGIPVSRLQEGEREKVLHLGEILHERVVGQDEAVQLVTDAIIRARSGIKDPRRPIGSFIFLGPTGVGKTELAKSLAAALFDTEENMVLLDILADSALTASRAGQVNIADKNYYGRDFEAAVAQGGICLLRPARQGGPDRPGTRFFRPLRQIIESANDTFKGQLDLERHRGHTPPAS